MNKIYTLGEMFKQKKDRYFQNMPEEESGVSIVGKNCFGNFLLALQLAEPTTTRSRTLARVMTSILLLLD